MTQNIYDDSAFFDAYGRLERSIHGLDGAPEWPALRALLPDPRGCRVLDLGCGYGWFCRQHRMLGTYFEMLRAAGFTVTHLVDWGPTWEQVAARPDWATELERPQFLLMAAVRQ